MNKLFKSYTFNIGLIVGLSIFVLWLSLRKDYHQMIDILTHLNLFYLLIILMMSLVVQCLTGIILTKLVRLTDPEYHYTQGVICGFVGSFFSGITPSSTGGQMAQAYTMKKQMISYKTSISVLWMDFIIYQCVLCCFVSVMFIFKFSYFFHHYSQFFLVALLGFIVNVTIIIALWLFVKYPKTYFLLSDKIIYIGFRLKLIKNRDETSAHLQKVLNELVDQIQHLKGHFKLVFECVCLHTVRLFIFYAIPAMCFMAIGDKIDVHHFINCIALASFVSMMNAFIPIPGASGGTEMTYVLMFGALFGSVSAKSTMLIWRFVTYYLIMMIGAFAFLGVKLSKGDE